MTDESRYAALCSDGLVHAFENVCADGGEKPLCGAAVQVVAVASEDGTACEPCADFLISWAAGRPMKWNEQSRTWEPVKESS